MDAGWLPEAFEVCRAEGRQSSEGGGAGDQGLVMTPKHYGVGRRSSVTNGDIDHYEGKQ
jgi:hypothetical protein